MNVFVFCCLGYDLSEYSIGIENMIFNDAKFFFGKTASEGFQDGFSCAFSDMDDANCWVVCAVSRRDLGWIKVLILEV